MGCFMPRVEKSVDFVVACCSTKVHVVVVSENLVRLQILPSGPAWTVSDRDICGFWQRLFDTVVASEIQSRAAVVQESFFG